MASTSCSLHAEVRPCLRRLLGRSCAWAHGAIFLATEDLVGPEAL